jgi:hypothetical protein
MKPVLHLSQNTRTQQNEREIGHVFKQYRCREDPVRSTLMGRPNWSQIIKQAGFKQALLRVRSLARFTVPKEQGRRSCAGEMAAQFLYPGWSQELKVLWSIGIGRGLVGRSSGVRTHCLPAGVAMVIMKGRRGWSGKWAESPWSPWGGCPPAKQDHNEWN